MNEKLDIATLPSFEVELPDIDLYPRRAPGEKFRIEPARLSLSRYDAICFDTLAGRVNIVRGAEREFDVADWMPELPPGHTRLASLLVTADDVQVIETHGYSDLMKIGDSGDWIGECRRWLPNLYRQMEAGMPIRLLGYGTSLTAQGGPVPDELFVPNGHSRDRLKFYYTPSQLATDTIARIPTFDHADGVDHVHLGFNWALKEAIERRSGAPVTYLNMGVSGTTTEEGENANGYPNGRHDRRLKEAVQLEPDLVVIEYCINDLDTQELVNNLICIIEAFVDSEVVVLGCPGFPSFRSLEHWHRGECSARAAAEATSAAFVPFAPIMAPGNEGATGLARRTLCSANGINHPGPAEMMIYGRWLSKIVA